MAVWKGVGFNIVIYLAGLQNISKEYYEAARIDGAGHLKILFNIVIPLSKPPLVALTVFNIIGTWNSFFWPLIVTHRDSIRPIFGVQRVPRCMQMNLFDGGFNLNDTTVNNLILLCLAPNY